MQVGDPFTEKLLIEACLELMATDAIVAIQDMGAAGLTSSSVEMAGKGGVGIELDLDARAAARDRHDRLRDDAVREPGAHADGAPARTAQDVARAIFEKWELDFAVIGHLTDTGRIVVAPPGRGSRPTSRSPRWPTQAPLYHRPTAPTPTPPPLGDVADPVGHRGRRCSS